MTSRFLSFSWSAKNICELAVEEEESAQWKQKAIALSFYAAGCIIENKYVISPVLYFFNG